MENQDPNQITPSSPEQVQVVQQPEPPAQTPAPEQPATDEAQPPVEPQAVQEPAPTGYDAFSDDDFRNVYTALCAQMGREFGIRHDLITENGVTDVTKFKNVLVVAKKE